MIDESAVSIGRWSGILVGIDRVPHHRDRRCAATANRRRLTGDLPLTRRCPADGRHPEGVVAVGAYPLHLVLDQADAKSVAAQCDQIVEALADGLPKVADHSRLLGRICWRLPSSQADLAPDLARPHDTPTEQEDTPAALTA